MKLGYLMNSYPMTSTTFIRREIEALEALGVPVTRYAVRVWDTPLVDEDDVREQAETHYLLSGNAGGLARALALETAQNPGGVARAQAALTQIAKGVEGVFARPAAYLMQAAYLKRRTAEDGVTHLHCHFATNATAVAMLSRLMGGPTYSFTAHGPDEFTNPEALRFDLKIEHAAFAVAITHFCRMNLMRWGGLEHRDKIHVVRCGIDPGDFESAAAPGDSREFVCVGRLCPQKGQTLIPEAVAPLIAEHPDLRVTLIGDGETRGAIEAEIARLGLEENFALTGWMANQEVRARLGRARALLLPSFAEGLPIVIMEAMALGRPVISTYIAGIPELLDEECGWIVPPGSSELITDAMRSCLEAAPDALAARGAEGRARVLEHHDVNRQARALLPLFEAAAS